MSCVEPGANTKRLHCTHNSLVSGSFSVWWELCWIYWSQTVRTSTRFPHSSFVIIIAMTVFIVSICKWRRDNCVTHWSIMVTSNVCMHALFPYIQPVSLNEEPLHKSLLSASSNPKLGCLSDLIGYAPFVVLTEVCVRVCVGEREHEWCWLSDDRWNSPVAYRECLLGLWRWCSSTSCPHTHKQIYLIHVPVFICLI